MRETYDEVMEEQHPIPDSIKLYTDHEACRYMLYGAYPPHISAAIADGDEYAGERYAAAIERAVLGPNTLTLPGGYRCDCICKTH